MSYNPAEIESRWQSYWEENNTFSSSNESPKPKFYILDMFPYPSGSGLHVGHPLGYIASDIYSRYKRQKGFNVLHPMGYDAFGLPAEQYAIQKGIHPSISTDENINRFRKQLKLIGLSYDWSREIKTSDPNYYKWTQSIFMLLFNHYYSTSHHKALPISNLVEHFEDYGTDKLEAFGQDDISFSSAEWATFSQKEKAEILMNFRLAYRKISFVNWCEELGTVLANDEVINGLSERGGHPVVQKPMIQWTLRITAYAERLLKSLKTLEWSDSLKAMQENWIGKSEGMVLDFKVVNGDQKIEVFTTRPDTIFGATFMVLAPEHDLVSDLTTPENSEEITKYQKHASSLSDIERQQEKKVTGAFTGSYASHPISGKPIPIYISEYVLKHYGTGAIMAVPSDDDRDNKFANKFNIPIIEVIDRPEGAEIGEKSGTMINSDFLNGMPVEKAIQKAIEKLESMGVGKAKVQYRLRDANFSRQRYWGEPFPIKYDENGIAHLLDSDELPLELPPLDDIKPQNGKSPLSFLTEWVEEIDGYRRETDTMPGYAGSSWYFLRYMDPSNSEEMFSHDAVNYWREVDFYVGGTEHAVGHLMYARFWHKFLYDLDLVPTSEPFKKLVNQGMIQGTSLLLSVKRMGEKVLLHIPVNLADEQNRLSYEKFIALQNSDNRFEGINALEDIDWVEDGGVKYAKLSTQVEKMSKRYHNVVNPDHVIAEYGCDVFRIYEMFLGPIEDSKPWNTQGISGVSKFLSRLYAMIYDESGSLKLEDKPATKEEMKALHTAIKKVNDDIERLSFNTCVSSFMILLNELRELKSSNLHIYTEFIKMLAPFAPHISEQVWHDMGNSESISHTDFPISDEKHLVDDQISYPVCIQGKKRDEIEVSADLDKDELIKMATELGNIQKHLEGKTIKKVIVVPGRMINIVV